MRLGLLATAVVLATAGCTGAHRTAPSASSAPASVPAAPSPSGAPLPDSGSASPGSPAPGGAVSSTRCHTAGLSGHVEGHGEAAGQRYAFLGLTNTASSPCTVYGYPGLQFVDASGNPTTTKVTRAPRP